jgi:hypothetical protein
MGQQRVRGRGPTLRQADVLITYCSFTKPISRNVTSLLSFLYTGAFLYVRYSFLLILISFVKFTALGGGGSAVRKMYCTVLPHSPPKHPGKRGEKNLLHCAPSLSPKAKIWAPEAHVHKTTYGPLNDMALEIFRAPNGTMPFTRPKKVSISRSLLPPTCLRNGFSCIKRIMYGVV